MLKIRIWDRETMHKIDYNGPVEYIAKQCFIDQNGFFRFAEPNGITHSYKTDEYMIDIFFWRMLMDYEEMILERQELDYEDPAPDYDRVDTRFFCFIDFAYRDCTECSRQCYIIDRNKRRKNHGNNH